jgi:transcriptional regulator with XRE-family HTH domain
MLFLGFQGEFRHLRPNVTLKPAHIRAARFLLGWTAGQLAEASMVGESTIRRFETQGGRLHARTERDLRRALTDAGIRFDEGEPGTSSVTCDDGITLTLSTHRE